MRTLFLRQMTQVQEFEIELMPVYYPADSLYVCVLHAWSRLCVWFWMPVCVFLAAAWPHVPFVGFPSVKKCRHLHGLLRPEDSTQKSLTLCRNPRQWWLTSVHTANCRHVTQQFTRWWHKLAPPYTPPCKHTATFMQGLIYHFSNISAKRQPGRSNGSSCFSAFYFYV